MNIDLSILESSPLKHLDADIDIFLLLMFKHLCYNVKQLTSNLVTHNK